MPYLSVGEGHTMYYETYGVPDGIPIVVLHGGPGGGSSRDYLQFFDLKKWFVVMYDQRGCGKSTPRLELKANTTWHLVEDIEKLRKELGIDKWAVFGGSWGTTLALSYASKYLKNITGFLLRGICLVDDKELEWQYSEEGAARVYPVEWDKFVRGSCVKRVGRKTGKTMIKNYSKCLGNRKTRKRASASWWRWESSLSKLNQKIRTDGPKFEEEIATIENHYFKHGAWLKPGQLLKAARKIKVPVIIVQGRYDMVCPAKSAYELARALPHAKLIVSISGHSQSEKGNNIALHKGAKQLYTLIK
jgi:proline iminopeptidase